MQSIWSEVLPQLKDVSLNYYNQVLSEDSFYTPDFFDKMEEVSEIEDLEVSNFGDTSKAVYDKKTGTLNKNQRTKKIDKFVVSFDFDFRNQTALRDALRDINSAATIQEIVGFINSKSYKLGYLLYEFSLFIFIGYICSKFQNKELLNLTGNQELYNGFNLTDVGIVFLILMLLAFTSIVKSLYQFYLYRTV